MSDLATTSTASDPGTPPERLALGSGDAYGEPDDAHGHGQHPTVGQYIFIGFVLAVLTAIEIALFYVDTGSAGTPLLLGLMVLKFALVVFYFMHLRFDLPIFRRMFAIGLVLAMVVFLIVLRTEHAKVKGSTKSPEGTTEETSSAAGD